MLSLWDTPRCSTHLSIRWCHRKILRPTRDFLQTHLQEPEVFLVHKWRISEETRLDISRLLHEISTRRSKSKSGTGKNYLLHYLRSPAKSTFKCLCKQTLLWRILMRKTPQDPWEQGDRKKRTLSNQPQLTCVTPTALLGSWVLQPIEGMTSLGTDFEKHAKWQGSVEEPAAKDFVARKVRTIELNEVQGTNWKANKCKEHLGGCSEAVVRQATINLDSQVWKSLGDSLPELYSIDLAEACVTREKCQFEEFCVRRKGKIRKLPMDVCIRNLQQKAERGEKTGTNSCTRFPQASCFEKTRHVCQKYGGPCRTWYSEYQRYKKNGMRNRIPAAQPRKMQRN